MSLKNRAGIWYYKIKHNGKEYIKTTGLEATKRNASVARNLESEAKKRLKGGLPLEEKSVEGIELSAAYEEYIDWKYGQHSEHPATATRVATSFASLLRYFKGRFVHEIVSGDLERFKTWRRSKKIAEVTIRHDLHSMSDFMQYAMKQNWVKANPVEDVDIPSDLNAVREYVVPASEEEVYFAAAMERSRDLHDVARLIREQGLRPDEVVSLSVFDYKRDAGKIYVSKSKTKAGKRTLLLTPVAQRIIEQRWHEAAEQNTPWLFPSERKAGRHIVKVNMQHDQVCEKTGLSFVLYEFRHTFATRLGEAGVGPQILMKLLGHSSLRCVMRYCHIGDDAADAAMRKHGGTAEGTVRSMKSASEGTKGGTN